MRFAVLIPCGPASIELERLKDTIESILHYNAEACSSIGVMNDGNKDIQKVTWPRLVNIFDHPRNGKGWGWGGGLIGGEIWSFEQIIRANPDVECVIKLDTDALMVRPLADALDAVFSNPTIGMAGSGIASNELPSFKNTNPLSYFANKVRKLRAPVSLWRKPKWHLRFALSGPHRRIAEMYDVAEKNGYLEGELIEGGSFAMTTNCINRLVASGITARWDEFLDCPVSDDVVLTMLPYYGRASNFL